MGGSDLMTCRKADFLALFNYARRSHSEEFLTKIGKAKQLFGNVSEDEYYLSRIGVQPDHRGKGIGRQLLNAYIENGLKIGFKRFRLDVSLSNERAVAFYKASGFIIGSISEVLDVPFQYCSMVATF